MEQLIADLDATHKQLMQLVESINPDLFSRRPSEVEWSIAENIHHLYLVEEATLKLLKKKLKEPPQQLGLMRRIFKPPTWVVGMRAIRVKAPKYVEPLNAPPKREAIDNFNRVRADIKEIIAKNSKERLMQIVEKHPVLGNYDGLDWIKIAKYHEDRHFKQIKEVIKKLEKK
jgi:hypothetical protein